MRRQGSKNGGRRAAERAKGTGTLEKHGRTWRAKWMVDGVVYRRSTGTADRREAEKIMEEFIAPYRLRMEAGKDAAAAKVAAKVGLDAAAKALAIAAKSKSAAAGKILVPLSDAWETYRSSLSRRPVSAEQERHYEGRWGAFMAWMGENRPNAKALADVTADDAEAFMRGIKAKFSPKTFNDYRALFAMVWKTLDRAAGLDGFNPWRDIATLDKDTHARRELTAEELARLVGPLKGEMRTLFALGIYTGLRLGDCVTLDWGAVDLARGFIQWIPRKTAKHGTVVRIPLFPALASILAERPPRARRGAVLPGLAEDYAVNPNRVSRPVMRAFEDAGIETQGTTGRANPKTETERKATEVGFHSLRHTFVSLCANAGVPLHIVQAIVGHTNAAMTAHYFHVSDDALRGAVAGLPDVFGATAPAALLAPVEAEGVTIDAEAVEVPDDADTALDALRTACARLTGAGLTAAQWREAAAILKSAKESA